MSDLKPQKYKDQRPAEYYDHIHERARNHDPNWVYEMVRAILTPIAVGLYRTRAIGTENVPADGPVLFAPNHFSNMDHFFVGVYLRRKIRFMAKSQLFAPPVLRSIFKYGGVFPVRRGHRDEEAFTTARIILERGGAVLVYAEGGRSRTGGLGEAKPGIGRIALENGVPVVPVAIHGSASVRKWKKMVMPKVTVQFGEPVSFPVVAEPTREQQLDCSKEIFDQVKRMYTDLDQKGRRNVKRGLKEKIVPEPGETIEP
ncbi:MAG: 1-acyl-sn-glycerol-3-phosphate acyltransferase [Solirubrobacterales bacterium]|nr:1-acyl-sn-glycerol-3-phosphate acyltransferase [Solirubrobacterales bacterium]